MKSSLAYQLLLYLGSYYFGCFIFIEFLLLIYKSIILPYPKGNLVSEVTNCGIFSISIMFFQFILLSMLVVVEVCRILSGWKGNLTENTSKIHIKEEKEEK